eukprot:SAG31_NODE_1862_length_7044_cov_11.784017_3_plen_165_part_00
MHTLVRQPKLRLAGAFSVDTAPSTFVCCWLFCVTCSLCSCSLLVCLCRRPSCGSGVRDVCVQVHIRGRLRLRILKYIRAGSGCEFLNICSHTAPVCRGYRYVMSRLSSLLVFAHATLNWAEDNASGMFCFSVTQRWVTEKQNSKSVLDLPVNLLSWRMLPAGKF